VTGAQLWRAIEAERRIAARRMDDEAARRHAVGVIECRMAEARVIAVLPPAGKLGRPRRVA
jgi:hypothetical protein